MDAVNPETPSRGVARVYPGAGAARATGAAPATCVAPDTAAGPGRPSHQPAIKIDAADRAIIRELAADSRLSVRSLAERLPLSRTSIHHRIAAMVDAGVLRAFTVAVDRRALGLTAGAVVMVQARPPAAASLADDLAAVPYVHRVLTLAGGADFIVVVQAPDRDSLARVALRQIQALPGVRALRSHPVLESAPGQQPWGRGPRAQAA
ncbi:MAG: Lrp/AsnC family transcriptional regulator [Bifidobacteriaceae bacterium]|jgi:DNA-binding Lrp family transcriptional regulator|nr:Lrp/AsnC family transcriptional regulator [Bifidobacteriaceae bacterium]